MRGIYFLSIGLVSVMAPLSVNASAGEGTFQDTRQLELSGEDRYALLAGLRNQVSGRFIISGLRDAEATCLATKVCIIISQLKQRAENNEVLRTALGPSAILNAIDIYGHPAATIVSLRAAGYDENKNLQVRASVLNAATGRWVGKTATLGNPAPYPLGAPSASRVLIAWQDSSW